MDLAEDQSRGSSPPTLQNRFSTMVMMTENPPHFPCQEDAVVAPQWSSSSSSVLLQEVEIIMEPIQKVRPKLTCKTVHRRRTFFQHPTNGGHRRDVSCYATKHRRDSYASLPDMRLVLSAARLNNI